MINTCFAPNYVLSINFTRHSLNFCFWKKNLIKMLKRIFEYKIITKQQLNDFNINHK